MTLEQVIETANANYPAIKAAQAQQRAAQGDIAVARTAYLPRTDVLWQTNRATANNILGLLLPQATIPSVTGGVLPPDPTRSAWNSAGGALLSWQPFDFGARGAKVEVARQGSEAAKQAASLTRLEVSADAGSAFFDLAAAEQLVAVAQANVRGYDSFDKAVHVLVDNSLRPGADASQADAQLALARNQLIQAQTQTTLRRSALAEYLQTTQAQATIDASQVLASLPLTDLQSTATTSHPAVLEEHALMLQQDAQKRFLDRSYVPVFSTSGMVFGRGAGTDASGSFPGGTAGLAPDVFNWGAGVQVSFAAFDFFNLRDQRRVQEANVQAEHARYDQSVSDLTAALERAQATLAGARQLAANTPVELSAAQASEQQQQARYRSGLATVVDVSAAEGVLAQAEGDDAIARLGVWRAELGVATAQGDLQPFLQLLQSQAKGK
ncbi:MAG TPA: TolC family protein [Acidobacteriaceae bacterium]|jgi:outer membrane protein TolC